MSVTLITAPAEHAVTTIVLPAPQPNDRKGNLSTINLQRSMNNVPYTYVKKRGRVRLTYKFHLFRMKALELQAFVDAYIDENMLITDYRGDVYNAVLVTDPFEYAVVEREEMTDLTLIFEGVQTYAARVLTHYLSDSLELEDSLVESKVPVSYGILGGEILRGPPMPGPRKIYVEMLKVVRPSLAYTQRDLVSITDGVTWSKVSAIPLMEIHQGPPMPGPRKHR